MHIRLLNLLAWQAYKKLPTPITLRSGITSDEYIDCRPLLHTKVGMDTAAQVIIHSLHPDINAIGGLTMGSDPIAAAVCVHWDIKWFSVRKQIKEHGLCERIVPSGVLPEGSKVTIVDDVITSGQSIIEAIRAVREASLEVIQVMALVDREMGGIDKIRAEAGQGVDVRAAFTLSEIRRAWERSKI